METKVLVAFASTHGATQEVAAAVADTLREYALTVDLQPARKVRSVAGYQAVVLGAPLYLFHLHKEARHFLSRHQQALAQGLPLAIFAGGPIESDKDQWEEIGKQLDLELAKFPWLRPVAVEVVGGRFDPAKLRFPYNLIPALKKTPPADLRDWDAIRAWASSLAAQLHPAVSL